MSSTIFIIQVLNSLFYAAVLFLIAAGLSLIYGVMRIVNLAHGTFYALGAYVSAWAVGGVFGATAGGNLGLAGQLLLLPVGAFAIAALGAVIEPTLLRPLYRRPEEYVLLITFGLLMILEDAMKMLFGGTPLRAGTIMDGMGSFPIGRLLYPAYNLVVIGVGVLAAVGLWWFIYQRASASSCAPPPRTGAWPPRSASTSAASTCRPSPSAASWRGLAAPWSCRHRPPCSAWAWMPSSWRSSSSSSAASAAWRAHWSAR